MYLTYCSHPLTLHSSQKCPGLFFFFKKRSDFLFCFVSVFRENRSEVWLRVGHNLSQKAFVQISNPSLMHYRQPVVSICPS